MKRFLAYARDLTVAERKIWEQAGFDIVTADAAATCGEEDPPIDLALLGASEFLPESLTPKVFVVSAKTAGDASPDWQRRYEVRFYSAGAHGSCAPAAFSASPARGPCRSALARDRDFPRMPGLWVPSRRMAWVGVMDSSRN